MKKTKDIKSISFTIILGILLCSFMLNVYQSVVNTKYRLQLEREACENIDEIKARNEFVLTTLGQCIDLKSITSEELLNLYKNYSEIADSEVELWEHYLKYEETKTLKAKSKKLNANEIKHMEIYWDIEELLYSNLESQMTSGTMNINISEKMMNDFIVLKNMSEDLNKFFVDFSEKYLKNLSGEEKTKLMVKKEYWVDILKGIQNISEKYIEYQFTCNIE